MFNVECSMLNVRGMCGAHSTLNIPHSTLNIQLSDVQCADSFSTYSSYSSAVIISSTSSGMLRRIFIIQPSPYGSVLTNSGFSLSASLTSTTSPDTGENSSETALTDSMLPNSSPSSSSVPTCGSSTKTTSPSSFCA